MLSSQRQEEEEAESQPFFKLSSQSQNASHSFFMFGERESRKEVSSNTSTSIFQVKVFHPQHHFQKLKRANKVAWMEGSIMIRVIFHVLNFAQVFFEFFTSQCFIKKVELLSKFRGASKNREIWILSFFIVLHFSKWALCVPRKHSSAVLNAHFLCCFS